MQTPTELRLGDMKSLITGMIEISGGYYRLANTLLELKETNPALVSEVIAMREAFDRFQAKLHLSLLFRENLPEDTADQNHQPWPFKLAQWRGTTKKDIGGGVNISFDLPDKEVMSLKLDAESARHLLESLDDSLNNSEDTNRQLNEKFYRILSHSQSPRSGGIPSDPGLSPEGKESVSPEANASDA